MRHAIPLAFLGLVVGVGCSTAPRELSELRRERDDCLRRAEDLQQRIEGIEGTSGASQRPNFSSPTVGLTLECIQEELRAARDTIRILQSESQKLARIQEQMSGQPAGVSEVVVEPEPASQRGWTGRDPWYGAEPF